MAFKILHTADWHLGLKFPSFSPDAAQKLTRARLEVVERILLEAEQHEVDAVLCAGDLFDSTQPGRDWWEGLAKLLQARPWSARGPGARPVFLLPGNHDPLKPGSPYEAGSAFRRQLPDFVHVVDDDEFRYEFGEVAELCARPCRSEAGQKDLALQLPAREAGDLRWRIGMVHGTTFDLPDHQIYFPIAEDAAEQRGFDYLAIGDTHRFRDVRPRAHAPMVYPSAPEATGFDERDTGYCALVFFPDERSRRPLVEPLPVGQWIWHEEHCRDMTALRGLRDRLDLERTVLRVRLDMVVTLDENREVYDLLAELGGTVATHGLAGVFEAVTDDLRIDPRDADEVFQDLPDTLQATVARLRAQQDDPIEGEKARRALFHLYQLVREEV